MSLLLISIKSFFLGDPVHSCRCLQPNLHIGHDTNLNSDWFGWPQSFKSKSIPSIAQFWSWIIWWRDQRRFCVFTSSLSSVSSSSSKCAIQNTNTKRSAHRDMEPARYSLISKNHVSSGNHVIHHAARVMWLCGAIHDRVTNDAEAASGFWTRVLQHSPKHSHLIAESLHRSTDLLLRCIFCHKLKTFEGKYCMDFPWIRNPDRLLFSNVTFWNV